MARAHQALGAVRRARSAEADAAPSAASGKDAKTCNESHYSVNSLHTHDSNRAVRRARSAEAGMPLLVASEVTARVCSRNCYIVAEVAT